MAAPGSMRSSSQATPLTVIDNVLEAKQREIHCNRHRVHVDFKRFYGIEPAHVDRNFDLTLSDLSYLPKVGLLSPL